MATVKLLFLAALLAAAPAFAQGDSSLARLQARALAAEHHAASDAAARQHFFDRLNAHARAVFARAVHLIVAEGVRLKTEDQMEQEMEDSNNTNPTDWVYSCRATQASPYICESYSKVSGFPPSDDGPQFETVVNDGNVSLSLPVDDSIRNADVDEQHLVAADGHPLASCQVRISVGLEDDDTLSGLACVPFLQGHYDTQIINLIKQATREALTN